MKKRLTDEQATRAQKIIEEYNKKYQESIRHIAKHRVSCDKDEPDLIIASRELNVDDNEIIFPPYGQSFTTNIMDYITIKTETNESAKSSKDQNRGKE